MATTTNPQSASPAGAREEQELITKLRELKAQAHETENRLIEVQARGRAEAEKPNGPAVAAIVSAGIGVLALGLLTTLAEASAGLANWLNWYNPTGPLSGKTTLAGIIWLAIWVPAHFISRGREMNMSLAIRVTIVQVALGVLLTFPPFFEIFAG